MRVSRSVIAILMVVSLLVGAGGMYASISVFDLQAYEDSPSQNSNAVSEKKDDLVKISRAYDLIRKNFIEEVDEAELLEGAIRGMLEQLDDPYSIYMDEETAKQFMQDLGPHFDGIGAEVTIMNGRVTIVAPFRDSPAEKAGLRPNDQIIKIDGEDIEGLSLYEAVLKIRGERGTVVNLTIFREGVTDLVDIPVTRDKIPVETVRPRLFERNGNKVGIIEITNFAQQTSADFAKALNDFEQQNVEGIIIDVRGNPGGLLTSVQDIGHMLIPAGKPILQVQDREGNRERYISTLKEEKPYPIITLIDKGSASASEILAAALKEAGGHDVIGETTFGKGTVQQAIDMGDGSELKLTILHWLTSGGNSINRVGVEPTIEVRQPEYFYTPPLNVDEPLTFDMLGEQVRNAQLMLKGLGIEPGRVDGYFGEQTVTAVMAFQRMNDLEPTGEIDKKTAETIQQKLIDEIRKDENDRQLNTAIELILKK